MEFGSKVWSSDTLGRGMDLIRGATLSVESDPDEQALLLELERLGDTKFKYSFVLGDFNFTSAVQIHGTSNVFCFKLLLNLCCNLYG